MTNRELPAVEPTKPQPKRTVQEVVARAVQHEREQKEIKIATGFIDKFFALFSDYSFRTHYNHKRKPGAVSHRSAKEIVGELRAFYTKRPRPWRIPGYRPTPAHAIRFRYRRERKAV